MIGWYFQWPSFQDDFKRRKTVDRESAIDGVAAQDFRAANASALTQEVSLRELETTKPCTNRNTLNPSMSSSPPPASNLVL
jgi:hypothetical protein